MYTAVRGFERSFAHGPGAPAEFPRRAQARRGRARWGRASREEPIGAELNGGERAGAQHRKVSNTGPGASALEEAIRLGGQPKRGGSCRAARRARQIRRQ
jgi:hypothetical protein